MESENRLLAALPQLERQRLQPFLDRVHLSPGQLLSEMGERIRYAYFPEGGTLSLLCATRDGQTLETANVGAEGMVGISIVLRAATAPHRVLVKVPSTALRIKTDTVALELKRRGPLEDLLLRYTHTLLSLISQAALCHSFHTDPPAPQSLGARRKRPRQFERRGADASLGR